ncbi:MAG: AAA family ATPase, partial [Pseudomonas sp.]
LSGDVLGVLEPGASLTPHYIWQQLSSHWQTFFLQNHAFIGPKDIQQVLSTDPAHSENIWTTAAQLADYAGRKLIEPGHVITAINLTQPEIRPLHTARKLTADDLHQLMDWLDRILDLQEVEQPFFGGIGRDWASGFTPVLNRFGSNLSSSIEHGNNFGSLTQSKGVAAMQNSFAQGANAVALIGQNGIGKTSHVYALAQLLLEGKVTQTLRYHQIIGLSPSNIISSAQHPGELEQIVLTLMNEAVQAGHIILFLDDAELFFTNGPGSFDVTRILQPAVQSGRVRLIMAMDPGDFQRLKLHNTSFANLLSPVVLTEQPEAQVMDALEDVAMGLEHQHNLLITYDAIREAYRLSGRYDSENAYPGKAIRLLEQSLTHIQGKGIITAISVQQAIETTRGVKAGQASGAEASQLLHLEDAIHERMINQTRAVHVVSAALRRARAGVANPKRPIGSFLFLGPTGVGKTELAKSIAATYFGDEINMVRLDM